MPHRYVLFFIYINLQIITLLIIVFKLPSRTGKGHFNHTGSRISIFPLHKLRTQCVRGSGNSGIISVLFVLLSVTGDGCPPPAPPAGPAIALRSMRILIMYNSCGIYEQSWCYVIFWNKKRRRGWVKSKITRNRQPTAVSFVCWFWNTRSYSSVCVCLYRCTYDITLCACCELRHRE